MTPDQTIQALIAEIRATRSRADLTSDALNAVDVIYDVVFNETTIANVSGVNRWWWAAAVIDVATRMGMDAIDLVGELGRDVTSAILATIEFDPRRVFGTPEDPVWYQVWRILKSKMRLEI